MRVWSLLKALAVLWLLRKGLRLARSLLAAAVLLLAWPVTVMAVVCLVAAWLRGWPPARLYRAAARALPMTAVYLVAVAVQGHGWHAVLLAPVSDWQRATGLAVRGRVVQALLVTAPVAVPAGLAAGGLAWAWRIWAINAGLAGRPAFAPAAFDAGSGATRSAPPAAALAAPGPSPWSPAGAGRRSGRPSARSAAGGRPVLAVPALAFARHMVIIGASGQREDEPDDAAVGRLVRRHPRRHPAGQARPLLAALDCKGGPDARVKADRTRRLLHGVGARRVAIWPDEAPLSLWDLPPRDLAVLLLQLTETAPAAPPTTPTSPRPCSTWRARPGRPPRHAASSWTDSTRHGWRPPMPKGVPGSSAGSAPPDRTWATSSSATPPCWAGSAPPSTAPAASPTPTPGTSSSRAPANSRSPKRRQWRSPS